MSPVVKIVTPELKDKAICYIIALALIVNSCKVELSLLTESVGFELVILLFFCGSLGLASKNLQPLFFGSARRSCCYSEVFPLVGISAPRSS